MAGRLRADSLVPTLLVVSQPVRMCIAGSTSYITLVSFQISDAKGYIV